MLQKFFGSKQAIVDENKINEIISRGVEEIFVKESLIKKLKSGKPLRVKLGIDPTGDKTHFGRAAILWKLKAFQDLGHQIILIVGDFTARIGDPSDKLEKRPMLSSSEISKNLQNYKKQIGKIIDLKKTTIYYNSSWLSKLKFDEISQLAESFSVQQMASRRNFKERFDQGQEVSLREFLYPLMQGYDSVMVGADVEIGGSDQLFNLKAGRIIQKHYKMPEQDILTIQMLAGTDGRKMSTSWGNVINITDEPGEMFGKIMSIRDDLIQKYFLLCTDKSESEIRKISEQLEKGANPRDIKIDLAEQITSIYWGETAAKNSRKRFIEIFSEKKIPEDILTVIVNPKTPLPDILIENEIIKSKSEWRRRGGGRSLTDALNGRVINDEHYKVESELILRIGKRRLIKITINS